jgi:phosphate-selective porin OprO/OprP
MPFYEDTHKGLHIGLAGSYRLPKSDMATSEFGGVRYSTRTATSINRKKYLDTDVIGDVHHDLLYGAELAGYFGGLRMQGEYIGNITCLKTRWLRSGETSRLNLEDGTAGRLSLFGGQQRYNTHDGNYPPSADADGVTGARSVMITEFELRPLSAVPGKHSQG